MFVALMNVDEAGGCTTVSPGAPQVDGSWEEASLAILSACCWQVRQGGGGHVMRCPFRSSVLGETWLKVRADVLPFYLGPGFRCQSDSPPQVPRLRHPGRALLAPWSISPLESPGCPSTEVRNMPPTTSRIECCARGFGGKCSQGRWALVEKEGF